MEVISRVKKLTGVFNSTLSAFAKTSQIDPDLLPFSTKAIELSFCLFPDEEVAFQIALDAALNVKRLAYEKHRYRKYSRADKTTKVLLRRSQIFQQMIWHESQKWERYQEANLLLRHRAERNLDAEKLEQMLALSEIECDARLSDLSKLVKETSLDERNMIVRYLKFLIQYSLENNPSYAAFAVSHLVYDYTMPEVIDICAFLNPDAIGGHYLYKLKPKLISKIKNRFGLFINFNGNGINEHFDVQDDPDGKIFELIMESSFMLIPWETECVGVSGNAAQVSFFENLFEHLERLEDNDQRDIYRVHAIICPNCYIKLTTECRVKGRSTGNALVLHPLKTAIPQFNIPGGAGGGWMRKTGGERHMGTIEMTKAIEEASNSGSIRSSHASRSFKKMMLIFVDGEKKAEFDPSEKSSARLELDADARLVKVMLQKDGELVLLATHLLEARGREYSLLSRLLGSKRLYETCLEDGRRIAFAVIASGADEDESDFIIDIDCRDYSFKTALSLRQRLKSALEMLNRYRFLPFSPARAFIFAVISAFVIGYFSLLKQPETNKQTAGSRLNGNAEPKLPAPPQSAPEREGAKPSDREANVSGSSQKTAGTKPERRQRVLPGAKESVENPDKTMSASEEAAVSLSELERIYIDPFDGTQQERLRELLGENLVRGGLELPGERKQADAVLRGSFKERNGKPVVDVEVVNARGKVIFKREFTGYKDIEELAERISRALLEERSNSK